MKVEERERERGDTPLIFSPTFSTKALKICTEDAVDQFNDRDSRTGTFFQGPVFGEWRDKTYDEGPVLLM